MQNCYARESSLIQQSKRDPTNQNETRQFQYINWKKYETILEELHVTSKSTNTNIYSVKNKQIHKWLLIPHNIQVLETGDGMALTQAHDIYNTLTKKFQEISNNINSPHANIQQSDTSLLKSQW